MENTKNRSLVGFALGDIIGIPYEFKKRGTFRCDDLRRSTYKDAHFILPKGCWSDDTSLMLCTLDALKGKTKEKIYKRWRRNAIEWFLFGKYTNHGFRIPYDVGKSCRAGIISMMFHTKNKKAGDIHSNGNGGLMRILPIAFLPTDDPEEILEYIHIFNSCSHNHLISNIGCLIYILFAKKLLAGSSVEDALKSLSSTVDKKYQIPEYNRLWTGSLLCAARHEIGSTGYVVHSLEAAIWCLFRSSNFEEAILLAVNLGGDTDTIAALTGGLAGIVYDEIPERWTKCIRRKHLLSV